MTLAPKTSFAALIYPSYKSEHTAKNAFTVLFIRYRVRASRLVPLQFLYRGRVATTMSALVSCRANTDVYLPAQNRQMAERNLSVVTMQLGNLSAAFMAACALYCTHHRDNNIPLYLSQCSRS